jgi:hypothetical protein
LPPANTVVIADAERLRVPSLIGLPMREIIEQAGSAGLEVEIAGNGIAREQAPAPGTIGPSRHQDRCPLRTLIATDLIVCARKPARYVIPHIVTGA